MRKSLISVSAILLLILIAVGIYYVPPVHEHLAWRLDDLRTRITYLIRPPSQAVFVPEVSQQVAIDAIVQATMRAYAAVQTPTATAVQISGSPTAARPLLQHLCRRR